MPALAPPASSGDRPAAFYSEDEEIRYGRDQAGMPAWLTEPVRAFLDELGADHLVVEIGSGRGAFDACHPGYVATDYSLTALRRFSTGLRLQCDAACLPLADESVDAFFSVATLEHVPAPARALAELDRCLRPGGRLLLYPAWYVRAWAARALHVRPYRELTPRERLEKLSIPLRDSRPYRFAAVLPGRLRRELTGYSRPLGLDLRRLEPNHDEFLVSDSDAFTSLDPQAVAGFFISRGYSDLRRPTAARRLLYGYEPVVVAKS